MFKLAQILRSPWNTASRWLRGAALTLTLWFIVAETALAQKGKPPEEQPKGYFLSYTLLVLCLVLGVYCTARPSKRTGEIKRQVEDE